MAYRKKETIKEREYATIPECKDSAAAAVEYQEFPEEKIWNPAEATEKWYPGYQLMARGVLTYLQECDGFCNILALENSTSGYADEHLCTVLHDCNYEPQVALKTLMANKVPKKFTEKWTEVDIELFKKGFTKYKKNFFKIGKEFLPEKNIKEIVEFYYKWKMSKAGKEFRLTRTRRRTIQKDPNVSVDLILGPHSTSTTVTRSVSAANGYTTRRQKKSADDSSSGASTSSTST
ncbi:arginine-glutamic acid dipeptide repeats protein [Augochlora pura]